MSRIELRPLGGLTNRIRLSDVFSAGRGGVSGALVLASAINAITLASSGELVERALLAAQLVVPLLGGDARLARDGLVVSDVHYRPETLGLRACGGRFPNCLLSPI
jgi:hypothetical protein